MLKLPIKNKLYQNLYSEFDIFIKTKSYGRGRRVGYAANVREFLNFIENEQIDSILEIKAKDVVAYYEYLGIRRNERTGQTLSEATIRGQLFSLRLFFDYLTDTQQIQNSPARLPKFTFGPYQERNICTVEEIKMLYSHCENKKEKALLSIAYGVGLRRSEIENLNTVDIQFHNGLLLVRDGKYAKTRTLPLSNKCLDDIKDYVYNERTDFLANKNFRHNPALFVYENGNRMSGARLNLLLIKLIKRTKNPDLIAKKITLHCLRHSLATHLLDNGATIEFVQRLLGHTLIDTAHLYTKRRKANAKFMHNI